MAEKKKRSLQGPVSTLNAISESDTIFAHTLLARTNHIVQPNHKGAMKCHPTLYLERGRDAEHQLHGIASSIMTIHILLTVKLFSI